MTFARDEDLNDIPPTEMAVRLRKAADRLDLLIADARVRGTMPEEQLAEDEEQVRGLREAAARL